MEKKNNVVLGTICGAAITTTVFVLTFLIFNPEGNWGIKCALMLVFIALIIAVYAFILAAKAVRINERERINSTEEFQIMLESTKNSIDKDIKNLRREVRGKGGNNRKPNGESNGENADNKSDDDRRRNNNRRRQYRRPQQSEGDDNAAQPTETEE